MFHWLLPAMDFVFLFVFACVFQLTASQEPESRFFMKPLLQKSSRRCLSPDQTYGWCTHVSRCPLPEFKTERLRFMDYFCIIDRIYVGVCCPDKFLFVSQLGSVLLGNPHFHEINSNNLMPSEGTGQQSVELKPVPEVKPTTTNKPLTKPPPLQVPNQPTPAPYPKPVPERRGCGLNEKQEVKRITGGKEADPKEWPWMTALMVATENTQFCGGCLITERHVLTAAHCVPGSKPSDMYVRLGEHDFKRADETRFQNINVSNIRIHRDYDRATYENDIAILRLSRDAIFNSYVWPICLPEAGPLYTAKSAVVIGWGTTDYGGAVSYKLMEVGVPVWANEACADLYAQPIIDTNLCAGGKNGKDSCQGDSGGPLMVQLENRRWITIGVVSWGIKCGEARPAVYTRVNKYLDWIVSNAR